MLFLRWRLCQYAQLALNSVYPKREHKVEDAEVIVYIAKINQLGAETIQQELHGLKPHVQPVQWLGFPKDPHWMSKRSWNLGNITY